MLKTLIKKQVMEVFSFFWQDRRKNKTRSGKELAGAVILYLFLFAFIGMMFYNVAVMLCGPLVTAGMGWLYFALMGLMGIALGVFGSVFNTYAGLYLPKDNDLLLAMPVKPGMLLIARLSGVYAMGLMYELLIMIPTLIVYYSESAFGAAQVIFPLLFTLLLSVFVLTLSAVLGFAVAFISSRARNKSMLVVLLSLAFLGAYFYFYSKAYSLLENILAAPQTAAGHIRTSLFPLYLMGQAAQGDAVAFLVFAAAIIALFAVIYLGLQSSYLRIIMTDRGEKKKVYRQKAAKRSSVEAALIRKEAKRFLASPTYMLNCGLGLVVMVIGAAAVLIKGRAVSEVLREMSGAAEGMTVLMACAAVCLVVSMNDITAPSVSLEGKNIWLVQALPVSSRQVLSAKLNFHLRLALIPELLLTASIAAVIRPSFGNTILMTAVVLLFGYMMAEVGLAANLLAPNLNWTSEVVPIKQSISVMAAMFGGWVIVIAFGGLYYLLRNLMSPAVYLTVVCVLMLGVSAALGEWLKTKGARIFENLHS